ncbi:MAG: aspartate aminotransferase family protein [Cyanobacteria bacterium HKST-UBA02]|nr:aspartate aminotransferase family protein [Cyanobacteria bacterium HKST-UBA02]
METITQIDRGRLKKLLESETKRFADEHKKSYDLYQRAKKHFISGVPMNWMVKWAGTFPVFVKEASGAHFTDVDGHKYLDLCLGDTGAMTGHSPAEAVAAIAEQAKRGLTYMLPTEDHIAVSEELARRFKLPYWQMALTATDANRFSIRLARQLTGRSKILVHNYCYHGTVDETFCTLENGVEKPRHGSLGPPVDPALTTKVVEFNDIEALEKALATREIACVLAEPVMTNIGIILPDPGYHKALRELTEKYGTLLIIDETHTICTGPGGYTAAHGLQPDILTIGKPIASGVPAAVYGFSEKIADMVAAITSTEDCDTVGIGGTLAGNALSVAAIKATLEKVLTEDAYAHAIPLAEKFARGVEHVIEKHRLPWIVKQLGCRAEYWFRQEPPRNGGEAAAAVDAELDRYMHLAALNRGILLTPFHNMALFSRAHSEADVDEHTRVFHESVRALCGDA